MPTPHTSPQKPSLKMPPDNRRNWTYIDRATLQALEARVGDMHLNLRLGIESEKEALVFGQGRNFFHIENWALAGAFIKFGLKALRLSRRGRHNARHIEVRHNEFWLPHLPQEFEGYSLLHISDSHLDMAEDIPQALIDALERLDKNGQHYDICVWTGDFRAKTHGPSDAALKAIQQVRAYIKQPVYAVLGNHDSIQMVPPLEAMGIHVLLNEHITIDSNSNDAQTGGNDPQDSGPTLYLAGIDDPHYYRADNLEKTATGIPCDGVSILLAHSPEIYKHAAFTCFDIMLCGHTHGGQICLPGGIPLTINANCPRQYCRGSWRYQQLQGYTSVGSGACVVDVRFNCAPEITLHQLHKT